MAVMAADLQEPPELILQFFEALGAGRADIVFGVRGGRSDPWLSELASNLFWFIYRKLVIKDMPPGGVDIFGCTREVRDHLVRLQGIDTNLIALLFWLGYRREYIVYERRRRLEGKSAWTFGKKLRYCLNSIFNFTDLPIQLLLYAGSRCFSARRLRQHSGDRSQTARRHPGARLYSHRPGDFVLRRVDQPRLRNRRPISLARLTDQPPPSQLHRPFRRRAPAKRWMTHLSPVDAITFHLPDKAVTLEQLIVIGGAGHAAAGCRLDDWTVIPAVHNQHGWPAVRPIAEPNVVH